jgi:multidrug efflux pump subunit AcrB
MSVLTATFSSLTIQGNDGKQIPLSAFATPVWGVDDPVIWRRQRLPFITVQTDLAPDFAPKQYPQRCDLR